MRKLKLKIKYNIALLPNNNSELIVRYAKIFSKIADQYILGEKSLPHLTLCQFYADPKEAFEIWNKVNDLISHSSISLKFKEISCLTFDEKVFWVSLLPEHNEELLKLHHIVVSCVKNPHGRIGQNYDPHITLMNTIQRDHQNYLKRLSNYFIPFEDSFKIAIGRSDEPGQFIEIIQIKEEVQKITCKL